MTLRAAVKAAIDEIDPEGLLTIGAPSDEYDPETRTILPRLRDCRSVEDVDRVVRDELARWFTPELVAGSPTCGMVPIEIPS